MSESGEDSSGSSDKDEDEAEDKYEDGNGEDKKEETWTMPGQVKRKVSERMLVTVSEKVPLDPNNKREDREPVPGVQIMAHERKMLRAEKKREETRE